MSLQHICKEFSGNQVLKDVSMDIRAGEIHALIGENGAGKSTLMNILFGMPVIHSTGGFTGKIEFDGEEVQILTPHDAMSRGIGMVHQEFMLIPGFTITENIKLNREITAPTPVSRIFGKNLEKLDVEQTIEKNVGNNAIRYNTLPHAYSQYIVQDCCKKV